MENQKNEIKIRSKIINDPNEILKKLELGISIPIWSEFHKYILYDLKFFQAKSMIFEIDGETVGHILIYDDMDNKLYFGYFGVKDHNKKIIKYLIDELIKYAREHNFNLIRGPINIPTPIYGFGFMKKGSLDDLFVGKPVNPPIYQNLFLKAGFNVLYEEYTYEGPYLRINPWRLKNYDFSDYEYFSPNNWQELMELKSDFLRINAENFPDSSKLTPNIANLFDNYADYTVKYGGYDMFYFLRYKPTGKIIACGSNLPNPFRKNDKGIYDSFVAYSYAIEKEHRGKSLVLLMGGANSLIGWKKKMRYGSVLTGNADKSGGNIMERIGLTKRRTHMILQYVI